VHAGHDGEDGPGAPVVPPVHRAAIHRFDTTDDFSHVMADSRAGYLYGRLRNASTDDLAAAVAALEGAERALCFASGMAAVDAILDVLAPPGTAIVAPRQLYGTTVSALRRRGPVAFADVRDHDAIAAALARRGPALLYAETSSNPHVAVADLPALAALAHAAGAPLVVDNTVATPLGCRPLDHGADAVLHSATKYLNGHSDAVAGVVAAPAELVERLERHQVETGAVLAPDAAWLVRRGMRTLHLRVVHASAAATAIAGHLEAHGRVARVFHPSLASHPTADAARRVLRLPGALLAFEVRGGRAAAEAVMDGVTVCLRATSLGGVETTISHPASTSHRELSADELAAAGVPEGLLRLSVGCEDPDDLVDDLEGALR
jgi:cystathionine gamma-synthase/O-acetylhomoserine (thiol)-lyase